MDNQKQRRMELRRENGTRKLPTPKEKYLGPEYAMSFACFSCRTAQKRHFDATPNDYPKTMECPICKDTMINLGRHFKAPKKSDLNQWKKVKYLADYGFVFQKIRINKNSYESIPYPKTLSEAKEFVIKYKKWAWDVNNAL